MLALFYDAGISYILLGGQSKASVVDKEFVRVFCVFIRNYRPLKN